MVYVPVARVSSVPHIYCMYVNGAYRIFAVCGEGFPSAIASESQLYYISSSVRALGQPVAGLVAGRHVAWRLFASCPPTITLHLVPELVLLPSARFSHSCRLSFLA
jgi:hypothetical protein